MQTHHNTVKILAITIALLLALFCMPAFASESGGSGGDSGGGSDGTDAGSSLGPTRNPITREASFNVSDPLDLAAQTIRDIMAEGAEQEAIQACRSIGQ